MNKYSVTWRDSEGQSQTQSFEANSATGAMAAALEKVEFLRLHPNHINRVLLETQP
jgi:hypothetical protein